MLRRWGHVIGLTVVGWGLSGCGLFTNGDSCVNLDSSLRTYQLTTNQISADGKLTLVYIPSDGDLTCLSNFKTTRKSIRVDSEAGTLAEEELGPENRVTLTLDRTNLPPPPNKLAINVYLVFQGNIYPARPTTVSDLEIELN